jgi:hypothetical protein
VKAARLRRLFLIDLLLFADATGGTTEPDVRGDHREYNASFSTAKHKYMEIEVYNRES